MAAGFGRLDLCRFLIHQGADVGANVLIGGNVLIGASGDKESGLSVT